MTIWTTLGLSPTNDEREIRRAYARKLKTVHPEDDPEGFQTLRQAHDQAMQMAKNGWAAPRRTAPAPTPQDSPEDAPPANDAWDDDEEDYGHQADWGDDPARAWTVAPPPEAGPGWNDSSTRDWSPQASETPPQGRPRPRRNRRHDDAPVDPVLQAELEQDRERERAHDRLCNALTSWLNNPGLDDPNHALELLLSILRSPAMGSIQVHAGTERWLAGLLTHDNPASENLVEPAIQFFGWDDRRIGVDLGYAQGVIHRRETLNQIRALRRAFNPGNDAYQALAQKPTPLSRLFAPFRPGLAAKVAALLERMTYQLPGLEKELDPAAVAFWRDRLSKPRLDSRFLWLALLAPPVVGGFTVAAGSFGPPALIDWLAASVAGWSALMLIGLAAVHAVARPARDWPRNDPWGKPLWVRFGWIAAAAPLTLAAGFSAQGLWAPLVVAILFTALVGWARIVTSHLGRPPRDNSAWLWPIAPVVWLLIESQVVGGPAGALIIAVIGLCMLLMTGRQAILDEWVHIPDALRARVGAALASGAVLAGVAAWFGPGFGLAGPAAALTILVHIMDKPLSGTAIGWLAGARGGVLAFGWIAAMIVAVVMAGQGGDEAFVRFAFSTFALWLVIPALMTGLSHLPWLRDLDLRFRKKR